MPTPRFSQATVRIGDALALACLVFTAYPVQGQTNPPAANDQAVTLDPFTVAGKQVYGYQASTSITATGIGTAIADIPENINVITSEYLVDRDISELRYAVNNVSSVDTDNRVLDRTANLQVRGLPAPIQQNGFPAGYLSLENVDRIEVIKGPSAVFNGNVLPGGVITVIKNEPEFVQSTSLYGQYGTFDSFKTELRTTGAIIPNVLAYNVFASYKDDHDFDQYTFDQEKFISAGLKWVPNSKLVALLDFEIENETLEGISEEIPGSNTAFLAAVKAGTVPYLETSAAWLTANVPNGANAVNLNTIVPFGLYYPYKGFNPLGPDAPSQYNGYNIRSDNSFLATDWLSLHLKSEYVNVYASTIDFNTFRPVAGQLPGQLIVDSNYVETNNTTTTFSTKAEAVATFGLFGIEQRILGGFEDDITKTQQIQLTSPVIIWNPLTQPPLDGKREIAAAYPNGTPVLPPFSTNLERAFYAADQLTALHDEIHLLVGLRYTELSNATGLNQAKGTPELGLLYRPLKWISVYYNYSETFLPNYILDAYGNQVGPTTGKGHDVGMKLDLFDSKLSATMAIYKEDYANIPTVNVPLELITGKSPLYDLSGLEETAGFESDLTYSPIRNDQMIASFSNSWEHRTIVSSTVLQDNVPLGYVAKYNFNFWNKYTFVTAPLNGLYIGVGAKAVSNGAHLNPSYSVALYGGGSFIFNGAIGYRLKLGAVRCTVAYNINNIFNEVYYSGYLSYAEPREQTISARFSF